MSQRPHTAVIVPVYNSSDTLNELITRLKASLELYTENYAIILIDDRGPEDVWSIIQAEAASDDRVKGLRLSRNFGQHQAITAGLYEAQADWYVVMDCDLQDLPESIPELYNHAVEGGFDSVIAERAEQSVSRFKKLGSILFNGTLRWLADVPASSKIGNFRIFNHKMANAYREFPEKMRLFPALMSHLGFNVGHFKVRRPNRSSGESNYNLRKLLELGLDAVISNSFKPMYYMAGAGFFASMIAFLSVIFLVLRKFLFDIEVEGWASLMAAIVLIGGLQLFAISFVGIYVGKVFFEVKGRPNYIVTERLNIER